MLLFLLLLLPLSLIGYYLYKKDSKLIIVIAIGFLSSIIICAINFFFQFSHRIVPFSFWLNFVYYVEKLGLLPISIIYLIFILLTKDSFKDKIYFYIPLMLSYYMVLIPYNVISSTESNVYSGFDIFIKPIIYLSMIFGSGILLRQFYYSIEKKKVAFSVLSMFLVLVDILIPSVLESMNAISVSFVEILIFVIFYLLLNCFIFLKCLNRVLKQEKSMTN